MKKLKVFLGITALLVVLVSCSSDNASQNVMKISAQATYTPSSGKSGGSATQSTGVVLTSFKINVREIEFKLADSESGDDDGNGDDHHHGGNGDDNHDGVYNGEDESELSGPWELDLLNQTEPITTVTIANGTYEEVELKLSKSLVTTSPIYNKTMEVRGTINGTPFVFWHDFDQQIKIDYHDPANNLVVSNSSFDLVFNIDLDQVLSEVNLNAAVDGDGDGLIEIGPDDTDGNNALAATLNEHIGHHCEMEDHNHHD
ncbi:MAG TPA: hypothetical protein PKN96_09560 [Flavobacterium sp.]|uniref:hypothetical protein n=1 Tax=Flavobacterium sp. TaxID=239 RepID=UPI002C9BC499|nr:hypothetical protein [Flavobacterium sp.]HNP33526.1 hypothetical protein [Flavobacterium sp.]